MGRWQKMNGMINLNKRISWKRVIWKLSKNYVKQKRFRIISISVTILIITILFTALLTLYTGIELSLGKYEIHKYGTEAHGQIFNVSKETCDILKSDTDVKDIAYSYMLGIVSSEIPGSKRYYICYDQQKSLEWEGINIIGKYPEEEHEIVVSTRLLELYGINKKLNQQLELSYTSMGVEYIEKFCITGYYTDRQTMATEGFYDGNHYPGTYEKIYVSEKLCNNKLSIYNEKKAIKYFDIGKTYGDGLYQVQIKLQHNYNISKQIHNIEEKYKKYLIFSGIFINNGWIRIDPFGKTIENYFIIILSGIVISMIGIFVINSIFQIPIIEDVNFWGLLQTLGVSYNQYRYFLFLQMQTYAIYGILSGGIAGYIIGYILIPLITNNFYDGAVIRYMPFQFWIPLICMFTSFLVSYICCSKVAKKVTGLSPMEITVLREESMMKKHIKKLYIGKYKPYYFAWKMVKGNKSKTKAVTISFVFLLLMVMMFSTFLISINYTNYIQRQLGDLDFVVLSQNAADGAEIEECSYILDALEENNNLTGSRIGKLEKDLILFSQFAPKGQEEIFDTTKVKKYLLENGLLNSNLPDNLHQVCLSLFGFDSEILKYLDVVKGEINIKEFKTGNYVVLTSETTTGESDGITKECKNPLYGLYDVGDDIILYGKKYKVMAIVDMPYVLCSIFYANELPLIMPYEEAINKSSKFCTYGAVYQNNALKKEENINNIVNYILTDKNKTLEYISRDTIEKQLKTLSKMLYTVFLLVMIFIMVILIIHTVNVTTFSIQNNKQIFAVLQSIGMQRKQQKQQILWENILQLCISFLIVVIFGSILSLTVVKKFCNSTSVCVYHYSIIPVVVISILMVIGISVSAIVSYNIIWKKYNMMELINKK